MPILPPITNENEGAPSLESICDLYRSIVNDTFSGGAGQINTDASPWMLPFLNSSTEDLYLDLGIIQDMRLIKDNEIISGIPGVTVADPAVQVSLTYAGYFDGTGLFTNYTLPPDLMTLLKLSQRVSGVGDVFRPMHMASAGLPSAYQGSDMGLYEVRGNNDVWMNGSLVAMDLSLRYEATWQEITDANVDFANTYIPIKGSRNAIAFKMVAYYAQRLSPEEFALAESQATKFTKKLLAKSVLDAQIKEFARIPFEGHN